MLSAAAFGAVAPGAAMREGPAQALGGAAALAVTTAGALALSKRLAGEAAIAITANGALGLGKRLSGAAPLAVTGTGALALNNRLGGAAAIAVSATGRLALDKRLGGVAEVRLTVAGALWDLPRPTPARTQLWALRGRWPNKAPAERLDYALDAAAALAAPDPDDTVAEVEGVTSTPAGLAVEEWAMQGATLVLWISGGEPGQDYALEARLRTPRGRRLAARVQLYVLA